MKNYFRFFFSKDIEIVYSFDCYLESGAYATSTVFTLLLFFDFCFAYVLLIFVRHFPLRFPLICNGNIWFFALLLSLLAFIAFKYLSSRSTVAWIITNGHVSIRWQMHGKSSMGEGMRLHVWIDSRIRLRKFWSFRPWGNANHSVTFRPSRNFVWILFKP